MVETAQSEVQPLHLFVILTFKDCVPSFLPVECTEEAFPFDNTFFQLVHLLQEVENVKP